VLEGRVVAAVERKSLSDLVSSLTGGRLRYALREGLVAVSSFDVGVPDELAEPPVGAEALVDGGVDDSS
jgi:hypothetical protein